LEKKEMNENYLPINLPSNCITYEGIKPEDITIRAYQGKDAIFLAEINPINLAQKFLLVLNNVVRGIDPKRLTLGDRLYIMIWECINSYTDIVRVSTVCTNCLQEIEINVDLKNLNRIELPDTYKQPYEVSLPSGKKINLRLLTLEDEIEIEKWGKKNEDSLLFRYARSIVDEDDVLKRMETLRSMGTKDIVTIEAFHDKFFHGPDMSADFVCPKCKEADKVSVPFRLDFFFPYGRTLGDTFGKGI
jgi:hypothetical protein